MLTPPPTPPERPWQLVAYRGHDRSAAVVPFEMLSDTDRHRAVLRLDDGRPDRLRIRRGRKMRRARWTITRARRWCAAAIEPHLWAAEFLTPAGQSLVGPSIGRLMLGDAPRDIIDPCQSTQPMGAEFAWALRWASLPEPRAWLVAYHLKGLLLAEMPFTLIEPERRRLRRLLYASLTGWRDAARSRPADHIHA